MELTPQRVRELLDYSPENGVFTWRERNACEFAKQADCDTWNTRFAGKRAGGIGANGYRCIMIKPRLYTEHRLAWAHVHDTWPAGLLDHVDGNRANNCIANLREVSAVGNGRNARLSAANKSGVTGVFWRSDIDRWSAYITDNRVRRYLGTFKEFDEAVAVRKAAEKEIGFHENHGRAA